MKFVLRLTIFFFIPTLIILHSNCYQSSTGPEKTRFGIQGTVYDTSGVPLSGVKIFYTFNTYSISAPSSPSATPFLIQNATQPDSFEFEFKQNFPNPIYNQVFFRFALPRECQTTLTLEPRLGGTVYNLIHEQLLPGMYQINFSNLVDSLKLKNSKYRVKLTAEAIDQNITYQDEKELVVISNISVPNMVTDENGKFFFPYENTFIGETISVTYSDPDKIHLKRITHRISFFVIKDGYISRYFDTLLYPEVLIQKDIFLLKKEPK